MKTKIVSNPGTTLLLIPSDYTQDELTFKHLFLRRFVKPDAGAC